MVPYCYLFTCSCCAYLHVGSPIMLVRYFVAHCRWLNDHLSGKDLFFRFTARAFRKLLSIYVFSYFPFGFEGRMWDLIVLVPDHCLCFYFSCIIYSFYQNGSDTFIATLVNSANSHILPN